MSSSVDNSADVQALGSTLGALFFGVVFSCMLFGVSSLQVYWYYHFYPDDGRLHKVSVGILWLLDATHLSLTIFSTYHYGVLGFGNFDGLQEVIWSNKLHIAVSTLMVLIVQGLYAYRVWMLSGYHNGVLGYLVAAVVLGGFAIGMVFVYETYTLSNWRDAPRVGWAVVASFTASTVIDILISVAMFHYLRQSKGMERLNSRISSLIQYTLTAGVFTSAFSLACLFTFIAMPDNLIFLALSYILTRLYVNSFIAMLNSRERRTAPPSVSLSSAPNRSQVPSVAYTYPPPPHITSDPERQQQQRSAGDAEGKWAWVDVAVVKDKSAEATPYAYAQNW
ncbi:hypothetical protein FB451DRAFT_1215769 [Mycena latifolia]|nr:hypothetical protein FB451DRAFT_1215769 [Mycena latifolia]